MQVLKALKHISQKSIKKKKVSWVNNITFSWGIAPSSNQTQLQVKETNACLCNECPTANGHLLKLPLATLLQPSIAYQQVRI